MEKLNSIYVKTYNFVYLRAKSILKKEEDIQQLMKEVYVKAVAEDVAESAWYEWLGKQVYILGSGKFRKKKVREAELIEFDKQNYQIQEGVDKDATKEVICEVLEELPDMYQATLYAFYYDHLNLKEIATVMGYNVGAIVNRLNYVHKYLEKALDNYKEENGTNVQFSIEAVCEALRDWSANNQLSGQVAQNIYAAICREMGQTAENGEIEVGIAGANQRISQADTDDVSVASGELEKYSVKKGVNKKSIALFGGVGALVLLALIGVLLLGNSEKRENAEPDVEIEEQAPTSEDEALSSEENVSTEDTNVSLEDTNASAEDPNTSSEDVNAPSQEAEAIDSQYILPKSDKEKLSRADVEGLSKEQLRLARNEIYARHGMIFGVEDLDQYFATKSWYKPTISFTDFDNKVEMSIVEEQNIILIQQVEKEK